MRIAALLLLTLAGCDPTLEALTAPPPGATAVLDNENQTIRLSRGAAMAIACTDGGQLCDDMSVVVADASIAGARVAFHNVLEFTFEGPQPATSFVVFGKSPGKTTVIVDSAAGGVTYDIIVE
jgi:hypothetical protein